MKDSITILSCSHLNQEEINYFVYFECEKQKGIIIFEKTKKGMDYMLHFYEWRKIRFTPKEQQEIIDYCFTYLVTKSKYRVRAVAQNWRLKGGDK